jgi:hypothetical protein
MRPIWITAAPAIWLYLRGGRTGGMPVSFRHRMRDYEESPV